MADVIKMKKAGTPSTKLILGVIIGIFALIVILNCTAIVKPGHTGVVVNLGKVSETVYQEGFHLKLPFVSQVVQIDNRVLRSDVAAVSASKDLQNVSSTISVNYRIAKTSSAQIYKNVGVDFDNVILNPAIQECVKAVTAKFTAEELVTKRQDISTQMEQLISEKINPYGLNIEVFNIIDFEFSDEFNKAIEAKQTAQQQALKAEQDLVRIRVEAQQKIEEAKAEAEAYKLKNQEITDKVIAMEYIDKWDGKMPNVVSDMNGFIDFGNFTNSDNKTTTEDTNAE